MATFFCILAWAIVFMQPMLIFAAKDNVKGVIVVWLEARDSGMCITVAEGKLQPFNEKILVDNGVKVFNVWRVTGSCEAWNLSGYMKDTVIVLPIDAGLSCFKNRTCTASVLVNNSQFQLNGSNCFSVFSGHYWTETQTDLIMKTFGLNFQISEIRPTNLECNLDFLEALLYNHYSEAKQATGQVVSDICSPVEEIANEAVAQVTNAGEKLEQQVADQINNIQNSINQQTKVLSDELQVGTNEVISTLLNRTSQIEKKLEYLQGGFLQDWSYVERYFHYFLHILELVGGLVIMIVLYKFYKKAKVLYTFFKWLGLRSITENRKERSTFVKALIIFTLP